MHQTFYIDIDEEITSIIERLKKARTNEVIIVVPKRALLIQSIVNLRILKKEADENNIQLMMVTQDKLGKVLIEKAGIFVQQKIDNIADEDISLNSEETNESEEEVYIKKEEAGITKENQGRLDKIGSQSYFDEEEFLRRQQEQPEEKKKHKEKRDASEERLVNKELVFGVGENSRGKKMKVHLDISTKVKESKREAPLEQSLPALKDPESRDKKIESFFYQNNAENKPERYVPKKIKNYNLSKKDHKGFLIFGSISFLAVVLILAYLFLPKATLTIAAKTKTESVDSNIVGSINTGEIDFEKEIIPAKVISVESSISENYNSSGNKSVSNQKARGTITIYNEYSASPQPLVATTRFLSSGGKLFRLVNGVTIPGMEKDGETIKPGKVDAQIIADEGGEGFNIGPDKFSIPGFEGSGSEKYTKFYAKSEESMTGGGNGNQNANYITDGDISSAKSKVLNKINDDIKDKIKEKAGDEVIVLDDSISKNEPVYKLSNSSGDVVDSFQITVQAQAKAIVVNKNDLNKIVSRMISKAKNGQLNIDNNSIKFDFGKAAVDFENGTIDIKFHATGEIVSNFNLNEMKKEILGKNNDELTAYLSTFSDIKNADVEYWPPFINSRIPSLENRVEIILDK